MNAPPHFAMLVGKPVARVWRGHGSALFIEFGELGNVVSPSGKHRGEKGEFTLMIEWSWRVERERSILGGSWSEESRWPSMFEQLLGCTVVEVEARGRLPEVEILLSNRLRVCSYMTAEGQPQWAILVRNGNIGSLSVKRGRLHVGTAGA